MKNKPISKPQIFDFLDVSSFLKDYYNYRKESAAGFSYEVWASQLGVKSRSLLRMVVTGQRQVTKALAERLSKGLKLDPTESKYFFLLIEYTRARSKEQRQFFWKQMVSLLSHRENRKQITNPDFLASHWLPKIQTLLSFKDLEKTSDTIASLLGLEPKLALQYLEKLEEVAGAKRESAEGETPRWSSPTKMFRIPDAIQNAALKDYYIRSFEDAKNAIALPPETRKFRSLLIPMNPEEYAEILEKLEDSFQEILSTYKSDEFEGRRLYQLNTSLVPLTKPTTQK